VNDPQTGQPFPGNIIPAARLDPAALKLLALLPVPNQPGLATSFGVATNNYLRTGYNSDRCTRHQPRGWNITDRDRLFWTYSQKHAGPAQPGHRSRQRPQHYTRPRNRNIRRTTVGYSKVLSPRLVNEFLAYAQRDPRVIEPWFPDFDVTAQLGIQRKVGGTLPPWRLPAPSEVSATAITSIG